MSCYPVAARDDWPTASSAVGRREKRPRVAGRVFQISRRNQLRERQTNDAESGRNLTERPCLK